MTTPAHWAGRGRYPRYPGPPMHADAVRYTGGGETSYLAGGRYDPAARYRGAGRYEGPAAYYGAASYRGAAEHIHTGGYPRGGRGRAAATAWPAARPAAPSAQGKAVIPVPVPEDWETSMIGEWPLQDSLELGALPDAVPCARLHTRQVLWEWRLTWLSDNAELIVSELLTNAISAARSGGSIGPVRLWLLADGAQLLILTWDGNPLPPLRVFTSNEMESGRGLLLVDTLATQWDWYVPVNMGGKVVWAQL